MSVATTLIVPTCKHSDLRIARNGQRRVGPAARIVMLLLVWMVLAPLAFGQNDSPRFEAGPLFSSFHATLGSTGIQEQFELGGRFTWNCFPHLALEGEYASSLRNPEDETQADGGYFSQALFGVKTGVRWKHWGIFAKFRPGLTSYSNVITSFDTRSGFAVLTFGRLNYLAFDTGGGAEFFLSRRFLVRYDASDLITHEGNHPFLYNGSQITFSPITHNNFESEIAVAIRF